MRPTVGINLRHIGRHTATALLIAIGTLSILTACNRSTELTYDNTAGRFVSIAYLKSLSHGTSTPIVQELKISGVVMANDIRGEFYKTLIIEDSTAGIEVAVDHTALADLFPLGAQVTVYCSGLALGDYGGKIQLGAQPTDAYSVDRIDREEIDRYLRCTSLNAGTRRPHTVQIGSLRPDDVDTYVHFDKVYFPEAGTTWCDRDSLTDELRTTVRTLADYTGAQLPVHVAPTCHYATEPIPQGTGSVNGIVDWFNGELSLRIINYEIDLQP